MAWLGRYGWLVGTALGMASFAGCTVLGGTDNFAVGDATTAVTTSGAGGATASSTVGGMPTNTGVGGGGLPDHCTNGTQDMGESDTDCGGPCFACPNGAICDGPTDCFSNVCDNGLCCDQACDSDCMSCRAANTIGPDGTCLPVEQGADPEDVCADSGLACGTTGFCDGAGACEVQPTTTSCAVATCDDELTTVPESFCDGGGMCVTPAPVTCAVNNYCTDATGLCIATLPDGDTCASNAMCANGFCNLAITECLPAQCDNNLTDVGETDEDCGGVCGATCVVDQACVANTDCLGNNCDVGVTNLCQ